MLGKKAFLFGVIGTSPSPNVGVMIQSVSLNCKGAYLIVALLIKSIMRIMEIVLYQKRGSWLE